MAEIPYDRLQIPDQIQAKLRVGAPDRERLAMARILVPMSDTAALGVCYLLLGDHVGQIADAARKSLVSMPTVAPLSVRVTVAPVLPA